MLDCILNENIIIYIHNMYIIIYNYYYCQCTILVGASCFTEETQSHLSTYLKVILLNRAVTSTRCEQCL